MNKSISPFGLESPLDGLKADNMTLSDGLLKFAECYIFLRGYSKSTHQNYKWAVDSLCKVIGDIYLKDLTLNHLIEWRRAIEAEGWSTNSINAYCYKLRKFLDYWYRKKKIKFNPEDFYIPKKEKHLPKFLTKEQCVVLYKACKTPRERLIICMLFSTGLRVSELCRIKKNDIQQDRLLVRGKANKERYAYLDELAIKHIKEYESNSEFLFPSRRGGHIEKSTVQKLLRDLSCRTGINVTPHVLRHTYATLLLQHGMNLRHIQELLGHADISTTQIYTHVSNEDLAGSYKKYHIKLK